MNLKKNCENCGKEFIYSPLSRKRARFCSWNCSSKIKKKEQDEKRRIAWASESKEEFLAAMEKRFNKFVIKKEGCWGWNGCMNKQGYGTMLHRHKLLKAHRASYMINHGEITKNLFVLHKCDNPSCSNPEHLFLGTHTDNMIDMTKKKRNRPRAKLTMAQVEKIREDLSIGYTMAEIARNYNVSGTCIFYIKHNKCWRE